MKITERLASDAKDDCLAHMLSIWSKSIRLGVCLSNSISLFILTSYSSKAKGSFQALCLTLNNDNATPHTMKPSPVPWTESLFSVSKAWHEGKDTVHRKRQSQKGNQLSSNRVGEIARRNLTDAVLADSPPLRREDCPCWTLASVPTHSCCNLTAAILLT
jgi:hypothetical protein